MALLYQKSKPQTKKPPDWVTPEFSTYVGCIILYGTSTPPTKGGEIAMMELVLKTIIGPIVVGVILRLVDKWLNKDK